MLVGCNIFHIRIVKIGEIKVFLPKSVCIGAVKVVC